MADPRNILAGTKAAGTRGTSLTWARNAVSGGTGFPTSITTPINLSFADLGNCDSKGVNLKPNVSTNPIKSFGSTSTQGILYTDYTATADVTFQETTPNVVEVYRSIPLGTIVVAADGSFGAAAGTPLDVRYEVVFEGFSQHGDGMRFALPSAGNSNPGDLNLSQGAVLDRMVTFTCYPDVNGNLFYEYYLQKNLASATGGTGTTIVVSPAAKTLSLAGVKTQQVTVSSASVDVTGTSTFVSSNPAVATVSASGLVTGVAVGSANITATYQGASAVSAITVTA